jgi:diadenosine tetraphosphate (Ap4A) HIT family hydrolase
MSLSCEIVNFLNHHQSNLSMATEDIFCRNYGKWRAEGKIIFENSHAYSILSVTPATPGHAIVISRDHFETLDELGPEVLQGFMKAIPQTLKAIQGIYDRDTNEIVEFYKALKQNPPTGASLESAQRMLDHRHLRSRPAGDYNIGINKGAMAGQLVPHLHAHVFPRRENGTGIVTAMRSALE